ncbi:LysR family transcriptional regulator [Niveibacterium terrae]|uniref:LysR family transcriptional regulator n=1 Tax=Niveibacterium terrae TaxID=3373598 RepID=UPI003A93E679
MSDAIDLRQLRYFIAVAEERNIGRAAARLHLSQPPLTRQIRMLEEALDTPLFVRTPKGVEPTEAGQALLRDAVNIRSLLEQATERVRRTGKGQLGRLDVGIYGSAMLKVIPAMLSAFKQTHPEVEIALHVAHHDAQIEALRQGRVALVLDRFQPDDEDLTVELLAEEAVVVALNRNNPLVQRPVLAMEDLRDEALILPEGLNEWTTNVTLMLCRAHGFAPRVSQESSDVIAGIAMVSAGFGSCLVPESAMTLQLPDVVYRPLREGDEWPYRLYGFYLRGNLSPALHELLAVARAR